MKKISYIRESMLVMAAAVVLAVLFTSFSYGAAQNVNIHTGGGYQLTIMDMGGSEIARIAPGSTDAVLQLSPGEYKYDSYDLSRNTAWGGGVFTVSEGVEELSFRRVNMDPESGGVYYLITVSDKAGNTYTAGALKDDGRNYFTLPVSDSGITYSYKITPTLGSGEENTAYWGSAGEMIIYSGDSTFTPRPIGSGDGNCYIVAPRKEITFTMPTDVTPVLYKANYLYSMREEIGEIEHHEYPEGVMNYTYSVPSSQSLGLELRRPGYIKIGTVIRESADFPESIWGDDLKESEGLKDDRVSFLTAESTGMISMRSGEEHAVTCFPSYNNTIGSSEAVISPDYRAEILSGDSVEVSAPSEGSWTNGAVITARKPGVSIIRISHGAWAYLTGTDTRIMKGSGAVNDIVLAVSVDSTDDIDMGIDASDLEAFYYMKSMTSISSGYETEIPVDNAHYDLTFRPSAESGIREVAYHVPYSSDGTYDAPEGADEDGFAAVDIAEDGSVSVPLTEGRNIIRVRSEEGESYRVLQSYGLDVVLENGALMETDEGLIGVVRPGESAKVSFRGLMNTLMKTTCLYNPGIGNKQGSAGELEPKEHVYYTVEGRQIQCPNVQYTLPNRNTITWKAPELEGEYLFEGGRIHTEGFGQTPGYHIRFLKGSNEKLIHWGQNAPVFRLDFSYLPDIKFIVTKDAVNYVPAETGFILPEDLPAGTEFSIFNKRGVRQLPRSGKYHLLKGDYKAVFVCDGYRTEARAFSVTDIEHDAEIDLSDVRLERSPEQYGSVRVEIQGREHLITDTYSEINTDRIGYLTEKRYTPYNAGVYSALDAMVTVLEKEEIPFSVSSGKLVPEETNSGRWLCEINNEPVDDYMSEPLFDGDSVLFYFADDGVRYRGVIDEEYHAVSRGSSAGYTVRARQTETAGGFSPLEGASIYIDDQDTGQVTDTEGTADIAWTDTAAPGFHTVSAKKEEQGVNVLTRTESRIYLRPEKGDYPGITWDKSDEPACDVRMLLNEAGDIQDLTLNNKEKMMIVFCAAEGLTDQEFEQLIALDSGDVIERLDALYIKYEDLKSEKRVSDMREAISVMTGDKLITTEREQELRDLRAAFNELSEKEKAQLITEENWLANAEQVLDLIRNAVIEVNPSVMKYNAQKRQPEITVRYNGRMLVKGTAYTVEYKNNIEPGTATAVITLKGKNGYQGKVEKDFTIVKEQAAKVLKAGTVFTVNGIRYKVSSVNAGARSGEASVSGAAAKSVKTVSLPASVSCSGYALKVTSVGQSAFINCKKLKSVTIGKNVKAIGKKAFQGCRKLKKITFRTKKVKRIGKAAFKKINKKAVFKVPKTVKKKYRKMLKKAGMTKSMKIR